jgi:hypothetical protein
VAGIIVDSAGNPTSATASFTFDGTGTSRANDTPAAHLLNGYLSSDSSTPATLQIDNIPASFVTYDVYVYMSTSIWDP